MEFEIIKNQPAPEKKQGRPPIYPLRKMNIGDKIVIPVKKNIRQIINGTARMQGLIVTTRLIGDYLHVWRVG